MKKIIVFFFLFISLSAFAQNGSYQVTDESYKDSSVEMADTMRSNGKIYVVVAVVMLIFSGLIIYTIAIDRKVTKIEKEVFKEKVNS